MYVVDKPTEQFKFKIGKKTYSIPLLQDLPLKTFREIQAHIRDADAGKQEEEAVYCILDVIEQYAPGSTESLTYMQALGLVTAYSTNEDNNLGES